ncbi:MAG: hypothetical protein JXR48_10185 [Candidatus Delongbacteria bacterium]|nr:hypothetical protein [Candidatus Delongbacteria bacterium]MBN2835323.1 hypothetical protein [Candidatus Delongbacteria bacterium]
MKILYIVLTISSLFAKPDDWVWTNTGENHAIFVLKDTKFEGILAENGDYLGVFFKDNDKEKCCGFLEYKIDENLGFTVWGDNPDTVEKDGLQLNEDFIWKLWKKDDDKIYNLDVKYKQKDKLFTDNGNYVKDGISGVAEFYKIDLEK